MPRTLITLLAVALLSSGSLLYSVRDVAAQEQPPAGDGEPVVQNTGALRCRLGDGETRQLVLIFNEETVTGSLIAVMLGLTEIPGEFHPTYGAVSFAETERGISVEFKNTLPVDWESVPLVNDTFANHGGRYRFFDLKQDGDSFRGRFEIRSNFVSAPDRTGDVPDVTRDPIFPGGVPEVSVTCTWAGLGLEPVTTLAASR